MRENTITVATYPGNTPRGLLFAMTNNTDHVRVFSRIYF